MSKELKIADIFSETRKAAQEINNLDDVLRKKLVEEIGLKISSNKSKIITENQKDQDVMSNDDPKKDRLVLNEDRLDDIVSSSKQIAGMKDPAGTIDLDKTLKNGLSLQKISVPLGVVGVIYESRPNVTVDIALLCLRSGNAVVLKGGKEAHYSNLVLVSLMQEVLLENGLSKQIISLLPTDRSYTHALLEAEGYVDILIPRGSDRLINYVRENAKIPTIETGAGVCHTYVEKTADLKSAAKIVINAKVQRPSVCNSLDTILVDEKVLEDFVPMLLDSFKEFNVEVFADENSFKVLSNNNYQKLNKAKEEDFGQEFLDFACSVKTVKCFDEALTHIAKYSSKHSECIVTEDRELAEQFLKRVDAAAVYHNASTRFTDGGVFELGAEIGISTQKLHARGPFGMEKLVTEKWIVRGSGQIRE